MKKIWILMLALLFLTGCAVNDSPDETEISTTETTVQGQYAADSAVEQQTQGAVRRYDLPGQSYSWLSAIGDKLLLAEQGENATQLTVVSGMEGVLGATVQIPANAPARATYTGFVYYDAESRQVVFLDPQLQKLDEIELPEGIQGTPVFSPDGSEIFYCVEGEIRALETERRISRLIKSHSCSSQELLGCYFEGEVIACRIEDTDGKVNITYLSTENGQTLTVNNDIIDLFTYEDRYLAQRRDGIALQQIVGTKDSEPLQLNTDLQLAAALELGGVVGYRADDAGVSLSFYDLTSGKKSAEVILEGFGLPKTILGDRWSGCVWLLTEEMQTGTQVLLRWDPKASASEDETVYTATLHTAESPDEAGLAACQDRVDALNKANGTTIRIWQTALKSPNGHTLEPEYQVDTINKALDELEQLLDMFPSKFLDKSVSGRIRICIVRAVDGTVGSVNYWYDGDPFIVLSAGGNFREDFLKGVSYVMDSHVLGNSAMYDYWNELNPEGFVYGDETTYSQTYLEGETMAFFSEDGMTSAKEDRANLFYQAMQPDNSAAFRSETMQNKLRLLCEAVRESWKLKKKTEVYSWEQYLAEPIAYDG